MTDITEKIASLETDAKEAHDYTNMPMEVDPRYILELIAHIRALLDERDTLLDALRQITEWPDGGNLYGQENIKRFTQATIDAVLGQKNRSD